MPMIRRLALPICCMLSGWCYGQDTPNSATVQRLDRLWRRFEPVRPNVGSRDLFGFALEAAAAGYRPERITKALELAEQMQDRDPNSRTYGNFRWYWRAEKPEDWNAVEFCMQKGALVRMLHTDRLDADGRRRLERLIRYSIEGIRRHNVRESYTNIFLMKTWNCIALGEATNRPDLAAEGRSMLDRWLMHTWENGVSEYLSPTYYGVDLDSLGLIARYAKDPATRRDAEAALRLMWTDIAANFFVPCARLGGAHSRDYDFLTGHGYLDIHLRMAGWIDADRPDPPSTFFQLCRWAPPKDLPAKLPAPGGRFVHQRWGAAPGQAASHYVGKSFSLGSAGANYGPMDKPLTVNLAGGPKMPMLNFVMDAREDPYGKKRIPAGGGHSKTFHLQPFLASVQRGAEAVLIASADPNSVRFRRRAPQPNCLLSHMVLPAGLEVWLGDAPLKLRKDTRRYPLPTDRPVFLRFKDVAVAVRLLAVRPEGDAAAPVELVTDGGQYGTMRLTCTHSAAKPTRRATVAVWLSAAEGLDEAGFARFRGTRRVQTVGREGTVVSAAGRGPGASLRLVVDVAAERRLRVEGGAVDALLAVNGRDLGREILGRVGVVARYERLLAGATAGGPGASKPGRTIEAEAAALIVPPFRIASDAAASGGKFLWMPGKEGLGGGSGVARAIWPVHVPQAGTYYLWGRVQAPTPNDDSFFVRLAQNRRDVVPRSAWHTGTRKQWQWIPLRIDGRAGPVAIRLEAGAALIEFGCREDGARLDGICLTAKADRPPE
jgi:hypothetical protein